MAQIPRQEDWGIMDAVGTLLRREGRSLYAEDSFVVQFKSRTAKRVEFTTEKFQALLDQELAVFIARVDLRSSIVELFSVGSILCHPNALGASSLTVYLKEGKTAPVGEELVGYTGDPILKWAITQTEEPRFQVQFYEVLKAWLIWDRNNRRVRKTGMQTMVHWQTNQLPVSGGTTFMMGPGRETQALNEVVPFIEALASFASRDTSLVPVLAGLLPWLKRRGISTPFADLSLQIGVFQQCRDLGEAALCKFPDATLALVLLVGDYRVESFTFWLIPSTGATRKKAGSVDELRNEGFEIEIDAESGLVRTLGLGERWLAEREYHLVGESEEHSAFLLRKRRDPIKLPSCPS